MVKTSCALLNVSFSTSNVPEGATRVQNRSSPYAKTSDVDSSNAGAVSMRRTFATYSSEGKGGGLESRSPEKAEGTYNTRGSGVRAHDARHLGVRDHTEQATLPVPPLSACPSYVEDSIVGGGRCESDHFHSPLDSQHLTISLRCCEF
jgi:hypothetical protein